MIRWSCTLKMSGRLYVAKAEATNEADRWVHVRFDLDSGEQLRFSDVRKFGRVYLTNDLERLLGHLGPEPLSDDFSLEAFHAGMGGRQRAIKAHLLDQEMVAGVGNIYADEALFRAGIHPATAAGILTAEQTARLQQTIRDALRDGIQHEGASINWYRKPDGQKGESQNHFYVYGRAGLPCRSCGAAINKIRVAQRGTHFCPLCQPEARFNPTPKPPPLMERGLQSRTSSWSLQFQLESQRALGSPYIVVRAPQIRHRPATAITGCRI